ncbi:MAG: hypothetical protein ACRD3C_13085 [Vicinamibacterales bacterium]
MPRIFATVLVLLVPVVMGLVVPLWSRERDVRERMSASKALTDAYIGTLCRPPDGPETVRWDGRPFQNEELLPALQLSPEGLRVGEIRRVYLDVLGRDPVDGDCAALRRWVDGPLDAEQVRREIAGWPEARRVVQVRRVFIEALGRDPAGWDHATLRRWVDSEFTPAEIRRRLAVQKPAVGVHYFTWYQTRATGWGNDKTVVQTGASKPALGWYGSSNEIVMDIHLGQIAAAGFDLVIVHVTAESPAGWSNAQALFSRLARHKLRAAVMLDGLYTRSAAFKAAWVAKVQAEFTGRANYFFLHGRPLIMLYSAAADFAIPGVVLRNVYWTDNYQPGANAFNPDLVLYPRDWPFWAATPQPLVNGVVPVVPGYADTHLGRERAMEYPRNNGRLYHEQWQRALALRPELILVYSWNEYFEQTAIEPTEAWGDQYLEWTACYIAHAHRGATGAC